jgi:hypothetical protein
MFGIVQIAVVCVVIGAHKCYGGMCCLRLQISSNLKMEGGNRFPRDILCTCKTTYRHLNLKSLCGENLVSVLDIFFLSFKK